MAGVAANIANRYPHQELTPAAILKDPSVIEADEVARSHGADLENGLASPEASRHLATNGLNELRAARRTAAWRRALSHFQDPLIYMLLTAVAIALTTWVIEGPVARLAKLVACVQWHYLKDFGLPTKQKKDNNIQPLAFRPGEGRASPRFSATLNPTAPVK